MSHPEANIPDPIFVSEGLCIATTKGFNREAGTYACSGMLSRITEEVDPDTSKQYTNIEQLRCPLRLLVQEGVDKQLTHETRQMGYDVTIRPSKVIGPEDDRQLGGCVNTLPSYIDLIIQTNTSRAKAPRGY
jgi:hypothetical protein